MGLLSAVCLLAACEKEITLNLSDYASKLVVNGEFNTNATVKVEVSRSIPIMNVADSTGYLLMDATAKLYENNTLGNFSYRYFMINKEKITQYKDFKQFEAGFSLDNTVIDELIKFGASNGSSISLKNPQTIAFTKNRIKALIGRIGFGESGYFFIVNANDKTCQSAIASLNQ